MSSQIQLDGVERFIKIAELLYNSSAISGCFMANLDGII